ncbi:MAG: tetratricopeptide repeat protein [Thermoanaerobaculia bacterium]
MRAVRSKSWALFAIGLATIASAVGAFAAEPKSKIPITTMSKPALALYLKGRVLFESLHVTDARKLYEEAAGLDPSFAMAHVGQANTSQNTKDFFEATGRAVALAPKVSEGERLVIAALEAGGKGDVPKQKELLIKLVQAFPNDERAHNLLATVHLGLQEFPAALAEFETATTINPTFSSPYNLLGYTNRAMERYPEAEKAFKKYVELIPNDPNPYDSYAELLMKMGRFEESIKNYQKALSLEPNFISAYVGIGNDLIFMGRTREARAEFAKIEKVARNRNERRQAYLWSALSYVHEGAAEKALAEVGKRFALAQGVRDLGTAAGDANLMGNILLEAGRPDEARVKFGEQLQLIGSANVPAEVKEQARRNGLFDDARVALAKNDIAGASLKAEQYAKLVAAKGRFFEMRQRHELQGRIALAEKNYPLAVAELRQANQQDPRALYLLAVALKESGDPAARELALKAANFNGIAPNYPYVRTKAKALLARS